MECRPIPVAFDAHRPAAGRTIATHPSVPKAPSVPPGRRRPARRRLYAAARGGERLITPTPPRPSACRLARHPEPSALGPAKEAAAAP